MTNPHLVTIDSLQKENALTWLHLSDIHFGGPELDGYPAVLNRLLEDVEVLKNGNQHLSPDLIFITGDIAWSGKKEQYEKEALPFLQKLQDITGVNRDRIFLIPGNHDVDRSRVTSRSMVRLQDDLLAIGEKGHEKEISTFLYDPKDKEDRERLLEKHSAYIAFVEKHFSHCAPLFDPCAYVAKVTVPAGLPFEKLWVLGLNSAWLSRNGEEKGNLLLGYPQVLKALNFVELGKSPSKDCVFALTHHPLSILAEWDERLCEQQLEQGSDFLLSGHLHEQKFRLSSSGPQRFSTIATGSVYGDGGKQWSNWYCFVRLDFNRQKATAFVRQYNTRADEFVPDTTFKTPNYGEHEWPLPERLCLKTPPPVQPQPAPPATVQPAPVNVQPAMYVEIPQERGKLLLFTSRRNEEEFDLLLGAVNAPIQFLPGKANAVAGRAAALFRWAEGDGGCGLEAIRNALNDILNP